MAKKKENILRIRIRFANMEDFQRLWRKFKVDISCGGPKQASDGMIELEAYVPGSQLKRLEKMDCEIEVIEDATEVGKKRQKEVDKKNLYRDAKKIPSGLGKKE